jgi:hypothetical protein
MNSESLKYILALPKTGLVRMAYVNLTETIWGYDEKGNRCPITPRGSAIRPARPTDISYWWQTPPEQSHSNSLEF